MAMRTILGVKLRPTERSTNPETEIGRPIPHSWKPKAPDTPAQDHLPHSVFSPILLPRLGATADGCTKCGA